MEVRISNAILTGLLALLLAIPACATYIQLIPTLSAPDVIGEKTVEFPLVIKNNGDESAHNIQLSLVLPDGFTSRNVFYRELRPNESKVDKFAVEIADDAVLPGTYVVGLLTHYTDANQYGFSAVNSMLINYKIPTVSRVYGTLSNINLRREPAETNLTIRNRDEKPHELRIKLLLPDELGVSNTYIESVINSDEEKIIPLIISSDGALAGSTYPIIAIISYADENQHFSAVARGVVHVEETAPKNPMSFPSWLPIVGLVAIVGFLIYRKLRR